MEAWTYQVALHGCAVEGRLQSLVLGQQNGPSIHQTAGDVHVAVGTGDEQGSHHLLVFGLRFKEEGVKARLGYRRGIIILSMVGKKECILRL